MAKIIAVANQKGGVGKTTTTVNLSACIAQQGKRVLCVDIDPQGNSTSGYGIPKRSVKNSVYQLLIGEGDPSSCVLHTKYRVDLIPSNIQLSGAGIELVALDRRESRLREGIAQLAQKYDFIFIDCPPSLSLLTLNALTASDRLIIPVQAQFLAMRGMAKLMQVVHKVQQRLNSDLSIAGVLITQYDGRKNLNKSVSELVQETFQGKVFSTHIRNAITLAEAPTQGQDIFHYAPKSAGAEDYEKVCNELLTEIK